MFTDRERKMATIIYNLYKAKQKHTMIADLEKYMLLPESDIKESIQKLKGKKQVVEIYPGCYVTSKFVDHYRHKRTFNK
ncbi:hypothetical protein [Alkalicoccus halolimnae]|uniref:Transcriptional regulator n=1 Tax=Alkalicoccus halolimnae TaxID=1667239 RepID=A0A5C7FGI6_9BACI|nr:hypothetical protein [Alkalicoccus halolimnae]TXF85299.1 hypothetical protein FTX54_08915 [Alkalicoccus halolimnae]